MTDWGTLDNAWRPPQIPIPAEAAYAPFAIPSAESCISIGIPYLFERSTKKASQETTGG